MFFRGMFVTPYRCRNLKLNNKHVAISFQLFSSVWALSFYADLCNHYNWLLLCNAFRILMEYSISDVMTTTSRNCLNTFITLIPDLYGLVHVSYNVNILSHYPDAVRNWGPYSCGHILLSCTNPIYYPVV